MATEKSSSKHLLNNLDTAVRDNLIGLALANPSVQITEQVDAIVRKDVVDFRKEGRVLVVSGGGAGHEPMFAGFVGEKLLTAAVSGAYFASPSAGSIVRVVEEIATRDNPILFIVANYTGDRLNFGFAKEELTLKGFKDVRLYVFGDDLSPYLTNTAPEDVQRKRRGLAGIAFVHRIAGALAEQGKSLNEIEHLLSQLPELIFTISISLSACDIPGFGASFQLPDDQMELGLGVHGETGIKRVPLLTTKETIDLMLTQLLDYLNGNQLLAAHQNRVALIVNNLGGMTALEMNSTVKETLQQLQEKGVLVERLFRNYFNFTSGNMKGVSISLLLLDDKLLNILDQSEDRPTSLVSVNRDYIYRFAPSDESEKGHPEGPSPCSAPLYRAILTNVCNTIIKQEHYLNELDACVGDADCGQTLSTIGKLVLAQIQLRTVLPFAATAAVTRSGLNPHYFLQTHTEPDQLPSLATLAKLVSSRVGGSSGALYSLLLATASNYMQAHREAFSRPGQSILQQTEHWLGLIRHCIGRIGAYSGARINDRSMLDALHGMELGLSQAVDRSLNEMQPVCSQVVECTWTQARKTASMKASVGRAAYVNQSYLTKPDAGAVAIAIWTEALCQTLCQQQ